MKERGMDKKKIKQDEMSDCTRDCSGFYLFYTESYWKEEFRIASRSIKNALLKEKKKKKGAWG